jgi:DNA-binding winged helix-turn-helix (wHTH) protein
MPVYRFGEFVLDTRSGELRRGSYRVRLRPQPAAVLEYLLQRPGEVVSRSDLRDVLWPDGTFVHFDHGLNSCIKQLRAALLDSRSAPRFLETLPRRGYRYIGAVAASLGGESEQTAAGPGSGPAVNPDFVVSGTARLAAGRVRVRLMLTDPGTGEQIWSAEFDCDADDVRATQARITAEVLDGVAGRHRGGSRGTVATTGPATALM